MKRSRILITCLLFYLLHSDSFSQELIWRSLCHDFDVFTLAFNSKGNLLAGGDGIDLSTDQGQTWVHTLSNHFVISICVVPSGNIFATDSRKASGIFKSTNDGTSWDTLNARSNGSVLAVDSMGYVYSAGNEFNGRVGEGIKMSKDNGSTWIGWSQPYELFNIQSMVVSRNGSIYAVTRWDTLVFSRDNGSTWTAIKVPFDFPMSVAVNTGEKVFVGTDGNGVWASSDSGKSWSILNKGVPSTTVNSLIVNSNDQLFGGTQSGVIRLRPTDERWTYFTAGLTSQVSFLVKDQLGYLYAAYSSHRDTIFRTSMISEMPICSGPLDGSVDVPLTTDIKWKPIAGATAYHVVVAHDSLFNNIVREDSTLSTNILSLSGLDTNSIYYWKVNAKKNAVTGFYSDTYRFRTVLPPPTPPILLLPTNNSAGVASSPSFSWNSCYGATRYHLQVSTDTSFKNLVLNDSTILLPARIFGPLQTRTDYFWRVRAMNAGGASGFSQVWRFTTFNQRPKAAVLRDTSFTLGTRILTTRLTYSSSGSSDDVRIDSTLWYVNDRFISNASTLTYDFGPGTSRIALVVKDNDGATDTSRATVNRTAFRTFLNGPLYAGLSLLGDSLLYAVATGDAVYRLDYNGNKVFNLQVGGSVRSSSSISFDTTVYISSSDKNLYAFNKNGVPVWAPVPLGGELSATPVIDSLLNRIYIGVSNSNFFGVNRTTGAVEWSLFADAPIKQSAVLTSDRKLIFTTTRGTIYGIDLSAQSKPTAPMWTLLLGDTITSSPAIDIDGNFYAGTYSGKVIKVSLQKGSDAKIVWQAQTSGTVYAAPVIDASGTVFVGSGDKKLYALDGSTGTVRWSFPTSGIIRSAAALSTTRIVYVANDAGEIFALDSVQTVRWYYKDSSAISAPLLFQKGTLYAGTEGGRVVALYDGVDASALEKEVLSVSAPIWGTFQGNNQRTGVQRAAGGAVATIYPGDANNDGIVDVRDLLPIGRYYATTGTKRQNGSATWSEQVLTSPWNPFDACYADCDGNGTVDAQDVAVIIQNWHATPSGALPENIDRLAVAEQLLKEIDGQPQSETMKAIRGSIVKYMQEKLGVVFTFALEQNYPDPFNPTTTIQFALPAYGPDSKLTIYDIIGELVWERDFGVLDAGTHFVQWDGKSSRGSKVASGAYIYRLVSGSYTAQKRMLLLK